MRTMRAVLRSVVLGVAAGACSGMGGGACAPRPAVESGPVEALPRVHAVEIEVSSLEARVRALRERVDEAAPNERTFGDAARELRALRDEFQKLIQDVPDSQRRRDLGIDEIARLLEGRYWDFLARRVPTEQSARLRAALLAKALEPGDALGTAGFDRARLYATTHAGPGALRSLARTMEVEAEADELDGLLALDPDTLTPAQSARTKRLSAIRRDTFWEVSSAFDRSQHREPRELTYGTGTAVVTGRPSGTRQTPEEMGAWWDSAPAAERAEWLEAWGAEKGGLLEVLKVWDVPCGGCGGSDTGCRDCGGAGVIRHVRVR